MSDIECERDVRGHYKVFRAVPQAQGGRTSMNTIKVCRWEQEEDESDCWTAGCSTREKPHEFVFNNGGPVENGFGYCPYCGRTIKEQKVRT